MKVDMRNLVVSTKFEHWSSREDRRIISILEKTIRRAFMTLKTGEVAVVVIKNRVKSPNKMKDWQTLVVSPDGSTLHGPLVSALSDAKLNYGAGPTYNGMPITVKVSRIAPKKLKAVLEKAS